MRTQKDKTTSKETFSISLFFFLITIVVIPIIYYNGIIDTTLFIRLLATTLVLSVAIIVLLLSPKNRLQINKSTLKNPIFLSQLLFFAIVCISSIFAINKSESIHAIIKTGTFVILFLVLVQFILNHDKIEEHLTISFVILGLILSLVGLIQISIEISRVGYNLTNVYLIKGIYSHKNLFSQMLFFTFSFSIYGIFYFKSWKQKLSLIVGITNFLLILLLLTRSVWVSICFSGFVSVIIYLFFLKKKIEFKSKKKVLIFTSVLLFSAVVLFVFISQTSKKKDITKHISGITKVNEGNAKHRIELWKKSFNLIKENPVIGIGAGNYKINIQKYDVTKIENKRLIVPQRAHNDFIEVASENGILGLLFYMAIFSFAIFQAIKISIKSNTEQTTVFYLLIFFMLVGFLIFSFFDFPKERIEFLIIITTILAVITVKYNKMQTTELLVFKTKLTKPILAFLLIFLLFTVYVAFNRIQSEKNLKKVFASSGKSNSKDLLTYTQKSYNYFSTISPNAIPIKSFTAIALHNSGANYEEIEKYFNDAFLEVPFNVKSLLEISDISLKHNKIDKALKYSELAYKYAPSCMSSIISYANTLLKSGDTEKSYSIIAKEYMKKKNKKFKKALEEILIQKIKNLENKTSHIELKNQIFKLADSSEVLFSQFEKAQSENKAFETVFVENLYYKTTQEIGSKIIDLQNDTLFLIYKIKAN